MTNQIIRQVFPNDLGAPFDLGVKVPNKITLIPSSDAHNVILQGTDGGLVLTTGAIRANQSLTSISYNNISKTISYVDENGNTTVLNISGLSNDAYVTGGTYNPFTKRLTLTEANGGPTVVVDLSALLETVTTNNGNGISVTGQGTATQPLVISAVLSTDPGNLLSFGTDNNLLFPTSNIPTFAATSGNGSIRIINQGPKGSTPDLQINNSYVLGLASIDVQDAFGVHQFYAFP